MNSIEGMNESMEGINSLSICAADGLIVSNLSHNLCLSYKISDNKVSASEIILTLGQAFEVAYQLATKMKMRTSATSLSAASLRRAEGREELRETSIIT